MSKHKWQRSSASLVVLLRKNSLIAIIITALLLETGITLALQHQPKQKTTPNKLGENKKEVVTTLQKAAEKTAYSLRIEHESAAATNPFAITLFRPNYILPFYYSSKPNQSVYENTIPDHQKVKRSEFKAQISFKVPVWYKIMHNNLSFYLAYTQLFYWQVYTKSPYFRETNYEPEAFVSYNFKPWNSWDFGIAHQSNGRGGQLERSWNRVYVDAIFSLGHFMISLKPWFLIFKRGSSDLHNPDITKYLGHGRMLFAYQMNGNVGVYLVTRNNIESNFKRGSAEIGMNFPLFGRLRGFMQFFTGYGQSLIEYNHYSTSVGVGITFNNWI